MNKLKLLLVEDSKDDADLILLAINKAGYETTHRRVECERDLRAALAEGTWDLIISDFILPQFGGLEALRIAQEAGLDIPFIVVSGKIGEETAVEALKAGAHDYLLKDRLKRLGPAIERELKEAQLRRKRLQEQAALRESEDRYRRLIETSPEPMFILVNGNFIYINPAGVNLLGASTPIEVLGKSFLHFVHARYQDLALEYLNQTLGGLEGPLFELKLAKIGGGTIRVELIARVICYHGEQAIQVLGRDITERKRLEEQLQMAQNMEAVSRLAGGVAHDFNNLLTVILGYAGLVRSSMAPSNPNLKDIEQISSTAERAFALTRQLLTLSRKQTLHPITLNLNTVISQAQPVLSRVLGDSVELITYLAADLGHAKIDPSHFEQVLGSLAALSRRRMAEGGKFIIETSNAQYSPERPSGGARKLEDYILLTISDTGVPISEEDQQHIFEPFFSPQTKEASSDNGLDLATAYGIVKQHGGSISCYSEPRQGSTFKIYLPRISDKPIAPVAVPAAGPHPTTILVVEDEEVLRDFAGLILKKNGFMVLSASNGEEALRAAEAHPHMIDLLFTDVVMPRMGGPELAREFNQRRPDTSVLYTSGYTESVLAQHGIDAPAHAFLQKPYTAQDLLKKVRELVAVKRS